MTTNDIIRETTFYLIADKWNRLYNIYDENKNYLATIYQKITYDRKLGGTFELNINYRLLINIYHDMDSGFRKRLINYYENIVSMLTYDCRKVFTDDINERLDLPFDKNTFHIQYVE